MITMSRLSLQSKIYVAGHRGMVGSAIVRALARRGFSSIAAATHSELDLTHQAAVRKFFHDQADIEHVVLAAAKVGGIYANSRYPADFIYINTMIEANVINEAWRMGIKNLLFLGSSCIYPKFAPQPMKEEYLLSGGLEPTNEAYAIAKISGIKMCEAYNRQHGTSFRSVMPTNLYGPGDNYHLENSHVIPAMIRKYHLAKLASQGDLDGIRRDEETWGPIPSDIKQALGLSPGASRLLPGAEPKVVLWGTGQVRREFLHVDDMAEACIFVMGLGQELFSEVSFLNVGTGTDITIREVAEMVRNVVGFEGETVFDESRPDGTPRKLLDTSRINALGWKPRIDLEEGLRDAYEWYLEHTGQ